MAQQSLKGETYVWTDNEVELLLNIAPEHKVNKKMPSGAQVSWRLVHEQSRLYCHRSLLWFGTPPNLPPLRADTPPQTLMGNSRMTDLRGLIKHTNTVTNLGTANLRCAPITRPLPLFHSARCGTGSGPGQKNNEK